MRVYLILLVLLTSAALGAAWYFQPGSFALQFREPERAAAVDTSWLDDLYNQNPGETHEAAERVKQLGPRALPAIEATLQNGRAEATRVKAALKACGILGPTAAPVVKDVADRLHEPEFTDEAAMALSFLGPSALEPLSDALDSPAPTVRREALRSIGKLRLRAGVDRSRVLPPLLDGMRDPDEGVRTVAATYLGILHEEPSQAVPALIAGLSDPAIEVRRAAAAALGSFGKEADSAVPALRRARGDSDPELAREAGRALVRLQGR